VIGDAVVWKESSGPLDVRAVDAMSVLQLDEVQLPFARKVDVWRNEVENATLCCCCCCCCTEVAVVLFEEWNFQLESIFADLQICIRTTVYVIP